MHGENMETPHGKHPSQRSTRKCFAPAALHITTTVEFNYSSLKCQDEDQA